jgi:hypothetical protein
MQSTRTHAHTHTRTHAHTRTHTHTHTHTHNAALEPTAGPDSGGSRITVSGVFLQPKLGGHDLFCRCSLASLLDCPIYLID